MLQNDLQEWRGGQSNVGGECLGGEGRPGEGRAGAGVEVRGSLRDARLEDKSTRCCHMRGARQSEFRCDKQEGGPTTEASNLRSKPQQTLSSWDAREAAGLSDSLHLGAAARYTYPL